MLGVPIFVLCLLPVLLATMDLVGKLIWLAAGLFFLLGFAAVRRNRVELREGRLAMRGVFAWRRISLDRLASVDVEATGGNHRYWQLRLVDLDRHKLLLRLNGFPAADRQRLMAALAPSLLADSVRRSGPVERALDASLWWPRR